MEQNFQMRRAIGLLQIIGSLDAANTSELKSKFADYLDQTNRFVLDLEKLEFIDSNTSLALDLKIMIATVAKRLTMQEKLSGETRCPNSY